MCSYLVPHVWTCLGRGDGVTTLCNRGELKSISQHVQAQGRAAAEPHVCFLAAVIANRTVLRVHVMLLLHGTD